MWTVVPRGREALRAWRALGSVRQHEAWAAARADAALPDASLGAICAGYGRVVARRLFVVATVLPNLLAALAIVILLTGDTPTSETAALAVAALALVGLVVFLWTWRRRFRYLRLSSWGLLAVEAASAGVPDGDGLAATGPAVVRVRRAGNIVGLAFFVAIGAAGWFFVVWDAVVEHRFAVRMLVTGCLFLVVMGPFIATYLRLAARPVVARFTAEGWRLPHTAGGLSGGWDEVIQIRVLAPTARTLNATEGPFDWRTAIRWPGSRIVALVVADPEAYLRRFSTFRQLYARKALRSFGSPIVLPVHAKRTIGVVELVGLLRGFTSAPVNWR
jgi:hypothetical protein